MNSNFAKGFLVLIIPVTPLAFEAVTSPGLAATLATSESTVKFNNFSHNPLDVLTLTETFTNTLATDGLVNADASAEATFITNSQSSANNYSFSRVSGDGNSYSGAAQSLAAIIGYNFLIDKGETFSFNFAASLNLETSIDNPQFEEANANGSISLKLYDTTNQDNWLYLDSFTLNSNLATLGNNDYLQYDASDSISLNPNGTTVNPNFGGTQESIDVLTQGIFSRTFERSSNLTLVEVKTNEASVSVPEPSSILGTILALLGIGYKATSKTIKAKLTRFE